MPYHPVTSSTPDINAILRTLAQSHSGASTSTAVAVTVEAASGDNDGDEYDPTDFKPEATTRHAVPSSASNPAAPPERAALKSLPDPSLITTWPPALRYVTALIARDDNVVLRLQKLRRSQTEHETQWWAGRQALVQTQANRGSGRKQIEEILRGVGGSVDPNVQGQVCTVFLPYSKPRLISRKSPEDDVAELKRYDAKVYRALTQMHDAMSREFRTMGVPFFCTQPALLEEMTDAKAGGPADSRNDHKRISQNDLRRFQLRMLETLEDLSGV